MYLCCIVELPLTHKHIFTSTAIFYLKKLRFLRKSIKFHVLRASRRASVLVQFVNSKLGGSVLMMGGLSLGGQILLEILSQRKDICKYAIVESVLVIPSKFTYSMIKPAFGSCYGLIKYKWFSKLQFKSLRIKSNLFDEYYKDTCAIRKSDMIAFLQENSVYSLKDGIGECEATVQIYVGEKEKQSMKKSAKIIHEKLQDSFIQVLPNMNHGEFSINHADDYVRKLLEIVKRR